MTNIRKCVRWSLFLAVLFGPWGGTLAVGQVEAEPPRPVRGDDGVPQVRFNFKESSIGSIVKFRKAIDHLVMLQNGNREIDLYHLVEIDRVLI